MLRVFYAFFPLMLIVCIFFPACDLLPMDEKDYFDTKYDIHIQAKSPSQESCCYESTPLFTWDECTEAVAYTFQLSPSESFSENLLVDLPELTTNQYQLSMALPEPAIYYWRVRVLVENDQKSQWFTHKFAYLSERIFDSFEELDGSFSTLHDWTLSTEYPPVIQSSTAYDGFHAVQFGVNVRTGESFFEAEITSQNDCILSFYAKKDNAGYSYSGGYLYFYIDDTAKLSIYSKIDDWTKYQYILEAGTYTLKWVHDKHSGQAAEKAWIDAISISDIPDFSNAFEEFDTSMGTIDTWSRDGDAIPYIQSAEVHAGDFAVQFGDVGTTGESSFQTEITIESDCFISFNTKKDNGGYSYGGDLYFYIDDTAKFSKDSEITNWTQYEYPLEAGTHTLKWMHVKYYNEIDEKAWIDSISISAVPDFSNAFEEFDTSAGTIDSWSRDGETVPYIQSETVYEGNYAVLFGDIGDTGESLFQSEITIESDCIVSFYAMKDNAGYASFGGDLYFYINDTAKFSTNSEIADWTEYKYFLEAGTHTLKWRHYKYSDEAGEKAWIDAITIKALPDFSNAFEEFDTSVGSIDSWSRDGDVIPYMQSDEVYAGDYAVILGDVSTTSDSSFQIEMTIDNDYLVYFYAKKDSFGNSYSGYLYFYIDNTRKLYEYLEITDWTKYKYLLKTGTHTLKWLYDKNSNVADEIAWIDSISVEELHEFIDDGFEITDGSFSILNDWAVGGDAAPFTQSGTVYEGNNAVQFGDMGTSGESYLQTIITVAEDSTISFYAKKDNAGHTNGGYLQFLIDDMAKVSISYEISDWTQYQYSLAAGTHTLKWRHYKYEDSANEKSWIDAITIEAQ